MQTTTHTVQKRFPLFILHFLIVLFTLNQNAYAQEQKVVSSEQNRWSFLAGYGSSYPGWGETETRVETVDLFFRYNKTMIHDMGSSWYSGYHSLLIEPAVHFLTNIDESPMVSLNFLGCYTFSSLEPITPYIFGGGGPVYIGGDIPGIGTRWNGNYQFGMGIKWLLNQDHSFLFEVRYHHISNGNTTDPNIPLNSTKFLAGFTF